MPIFCKFPLLCFLLLHFVLAFVILLASLLHIRDRQIAMGPQSPVDSKLEHYSPHSDVVIIGYLI